MEVGVQSTFYEMLVTLDVIDQNYMVAYQACSRNRTSNNIDNNVVGSVFDVIIAPEAQRTGNNSAIFDDYPPNFVYENINLNVSLAAFDAEGDELTYSFCAPIQSGGGAGTGADLVCL